MSIKKPLPPKNQHRTIPNVNPVKKQRKESGMKMEVDAYNCIDFLTKDYSHEQGKIKNIIKEEAYNIWVDELKKTGQIPNNPQFEGHVSDLTAFIRKRSKVSGINDEQAEYLQGLDIYVEESIPDPKVVTEEPHYVLDSRNENNEGFFFDEVMMEKIKAKLSEIKDSKLQKAIKENRIFSKIMEDDGEAYVSKKIITDQSILDLRQDHIRKNEKTIRSCLDIVSTFAISSLKLEQEYKDREKALEVLLSFERRMKKKLKGN